MRNTGLWLIMLCAGNLFAQQEKQYVLEANYFYGNIVEHNPNISHLITDHPEGLLLHFSRKTFGRKAWEGRYNYPDVGYSLSYQNLKNPHLGQNVAAYAHLGFYFLNRQLKLRVGQGLAWTSQPYHPDENFRNNAYGSRLLSSTIFTGSWQFPKISGGLGAQAGFALVHYSNADFKSPNSSTNTLALQLGLQYLFDHEKEIAYTRLGNPQPLDVSLGLIVALRGGINTPGIIGSSAYPFLTLTAFAEKPLNRKSVLQGGVEFFYSRALEEYIYYRSVAFPQGETTGDEDANRAGIFLGHQLVFNKLSLITHLGYYFYFPYEHYVDQLYNRIGLQRRISDRFFASVSVRSHGANAEAVELSLGYRL